MTLDDIKLKRLSEAKAKTSGGKKKIRRDPKTGAQSYAATSEHDDPEDDVIEEGEKKHHTPKFVQHCVSAIMEKPKSEQPKEPFAVCNAVRNKNKAKIDAAHRTGKHHTVKDYEKALASLRESVEERRAQNPDPQSIVFAPRIEGDPTPRSIRYAP